MEPTPEQLLGLPVLDSAGAPVGVVADVGVAAWNQPKFLLVRLARDGSRLVRVDLGQVAQLSDAVRLAAPPGAGKPS